MDSVGLILIFVSAVIGILIGLLISSLKKTPPGKTLPGKTLPGKTLPEQSAPTPPVSPPRPNLRQAGVIWEDEKSKLFLQIGDTLIRAKALLQQEEAPPSPPVSPPVSPPAKEEVIQAGSLSIVEQVDDILQENLARSPLNEKGIHLKEDPQKGMIIWVGLASYENITDIPDQSIREIIRAAVRKWESKTALEGN